MSHNRNYTNFSKHFKNNNQNEIKREPITEFEELTDEEINELNETDVIDVNVEETTEGYITNCKKLYVREKADKNSDHLCIIGESDKVLIDLEKSTEDFYKVCTTSGVEGYCMKKFISIK